MRFCSLLLPWVLGAILSASAAHADDPTQADTGTPVPVEPAIEGTYHLRMRNATAAKVPIIGEVIIQTTSDLLANIWKTDTGWAQKQQTCAVLNIPKPAIIYPVLPPGFIRALPVKSYPFTLTSSDEGWRFSADLGRIHLGYDPTLSGGKLPRHKGHKAIIDSDQDGQPGVSVFVHIPLIGNIRIYMVQSNHTLLHGRVVSPDRFTGRIEMLLLEQQTIGADNRLFAHTARIRIASGHDAFEMVRIPDDSTCADIVKRKPAKSLVLP